MSIPPEREDGRPPRRTCLVALLTAPGLSGAPLGFLGWASTLD